MAAVRRQCASQLISFYGINERNEIYYNFARESRIQVRIFHIGMCDSCTSNKRLAHV